MTTPQSREHALGAALGLVTDLYLKREDLHPGGSHKGRSIPIMIELAHQYGKRAFGISSSGNAALAAIRAVQAIDDDTSLQVFVGERIDETKFALLEREITTDRISLERVSNPKQRVFGLEKEGTITSLRQSTNDDALLGYHSLADELMEIDGLSAVFIPTSSGTTAQALGQRFRERGYRIQIHIVQTTACHPIADDIDTDFTEAPSRAGAIVDRIALRKDQVRREIEQSRGSAWVVDNARIEHAIKLTHEYAHLDISPNSALGVSGLKKALEKGWQPRGSVVCLITGR